MNGKLVAVFGAGALAGFVTAWCLPGSGAADVSGSTADVGVGASQPTRPTLTGASSARRRNTAATTAGAQRPVPCAPTTLSTPPALIADAGVAAELLALITAEARSPSPPYDGLRAHRLAQEFAAGLPSLSVDLDLLRMLFSGPGSMPDAGRTLLRFVDPSVAVAELRRLLLGGPSAHWRGALPGEIEARLAGHSGDRLSEAELRSMYASPNERMREAALELLIRSDRIGADELKRLLRSDPSHSIRGIALDALISGMATRRYDRAFVAVEVLRAARDRDNPLQEKAIDALGEFGSEGTQLAVDLITSGAVPPDIVGALARTVVRAGRAEELVHAQAAGESLHRVVDVLDEAVHDDTNRIDTAVVARVLRSFPLPEDAKTAANFLRLAIEVGASDIALDAAQRRDVPQHLRLIAGGALFVAEPPRPAHVRLAAALSILEAAPVDAVRRREFLEDKGADVVAADPAGHALIERLAENDPDPWVRHAAVQLIRDGR